MNKKAKTIKLLLMDGTIDGVTVATVSSWKPGKMYSVSREKAEDLITSGSCDKYGIYLLLSNDKVYVGQAKDLASRIKQHVSGKDWWEKAVVLSTDDDSLNKSDIDFLESRFIKIANESSIECENKKKGNPEKVDEFREVELEQYLEEALLLLDILGMSPFRRKEKQENTFSTISLNKNGLDGKALAYHILLNEGFNKTKNDFSYSKLGKHDDYALNAPDRLLNNDWIIMLNDINNRIMKKLIIPSNSFNKGAFNVRKDNEHSLVLYIDPVSLEEKSRHIELSKYLVHTYNY